MDNFQLAWRYGKKARIFRRGLMAIWTVGCFILSYLCISKVDNIRSGYLFLGVGMIFFALQPTLAWLNSRLDELEK
jgi:hypothetical protein